MGGEAAASPAPACVHKDGSTIDLKLDGKPLPKGWLRWTCCNKLVREEEIV